MMIEHFINDLKQIYDDAGIKFSKNKESIFSEEGIRRQYEQQKGNSCIKIFYILPEKTIGDSLTFKADLSIEQSKNIPEINLSIKVFEINNETSEA